jgi:YD repeat-containing protein
MSFKKGILSVLVALAPLTVLAGVNVNNGNFYIAYTDYLQETSGIHIDVTRTYNSRSSYAKGFFGVGWSSEYEGHLNFEAKNIIYNEAGGGNRIVFTPQKAPNSWINTVYGLQTIAKVKTDFVLSSTSGKRYTFNAAGKLTRISDRNNNFIDLIYSEGQVKTLKDNFNNQVTLEWKTFGNHPRVTLVRNGDKKSTYVYSKQGNLEKVTGADGIVYAYEYDDEHNMTKIAYQDGTFKSMTYDKVRDWITGFRDVDSTFNRYEYISDKIDPENKFGTVVTRGREGSKETERAFFWYEFKRKPAGDKYNSRAITLIGNLATETIFTECCGTPQAITQWTVADSSKLVAADLNWTKQGANKRRTSFEYYPDGLLKQKTSPDGVITAITYDKRHKKIASVTKSGRTVTYNYDARGNLAWAFDSLENRRLDLTYDLSGRITIVQETKRARQGTKAQERKVYFRYNAAGQPIEIKEQAGEVTGTIKMAYNDSGQVVEVLNDKGRSIASDRELATAQRIAGTFQSLLEIVQPAGVSLAPDA